MLPPERTGVDLVHVLRMDHRLSLLNHTAYVCGGVAIGDVDGDSRPDLFFASGPDRNRLYLQTGAEAVPFRFTDATDRAGVGGGEAWGTGAAMADIDGDGDLDIYVCNYDSPNQLYLNEGKSARFVESARRLGLDLNDASFMPAFADYDNDGDLDLFVLTYRYYQPGGRPARPPIGHTLDGRPFILPEYEKYYFLRQIGPKEYTADTCGRPDRLYRQNAGGTFTDVSLAAGLSAQGHGLSATWWDYDRDGLVDLYVGNDFTDPDHLYRNCGDGTFTDVIADVLPYTTWSSMGADCADIDNDGLLDFISADMAATTHFKAKVTMGDMGDRRWFLENAWPRQTMRNTLYLNTGTGRFMEVAFLAKLASTDWTWAVKLADYDNDGRADVFITNGVSRMSNDADVSVPPQALVGRDEWEIWKEKPEMKEQNLAFQNAGDLLFKDVSRSWGLDHVGMSYGAAFGDLDSDGDLDIVAVNLGEPVSIYRNLEASGHRVVVELKGASRNRYGLGAIVELTTASGGRQVRQMQPMTGFLSSNEPLIHFGLGGETVIESLTVSWPSGEQQTFQKLAADRRYTIAEPEVPQAPEEPARDAPPRAAPQFVEVSQAIGLSFAQRETPFNDFARQPLLPGKLSQLGGGLAWGDADGDGDEDLFVAGARGQAGQLFLRREDGNFEASDSAAQPFAADRDAEDMAPLWLDADADGDLDLLVTSGGVECEGREELLADRLYLNDGKGRFRRAPEGTLPPDGDSSGAAAAGDIDGDGDLDLFIGGRVVPGEYPMPPSSRLLRNDGGRFTDITGAFAPGLKRAGMVTAALWSDVDLDGRLDLLLTLEWGPVKLFANTGKALEDRTRAAGLDRRLGWWNSITGADIDSDGDIDYVVMNAGLNTKYGEPKEEKPVFLYYGDMEGNGTRQIVEAKADKAGVVPVRGRSCSSAAMPALARKFPTYRSFAASLLPEIYTQQCLDQALELEVNHLESGLLLNDGRGRFVWQSLPRFAQASPGYGVVAGEFDGDGRCEVHAVENFFTREPETGLWRGGIGVSLEADGSGRLDVVAPAQTGLVVPGDGKGLAACDFDGDGWPDLVAAQNNDRLLAFRNRGGGTVRPLAVELRGPPGNPTGAGARVTVTYAGTHAGGRTQAAEVYAGSGYLSQSTAVLYFARGEGPVRSAAVRWPDGRTETVEVPEDAARVVIEHAAAK
jgi:hypothetical protein